MLTYFDSLFYIFSLPLKQGWHVLVLIFVTSLAASSVDSLQNGITSILSSTFVKYFSAKPGLIKWLNRAILVIVNIIAVVKSAQRYNVLGLFLVADLVCATAVFPVFLGLINPETARIKSLAPTELGAFVGCIGGIAAVLIIGCVVDYDLYGSKPFEFFWLNVENQLCALCGTTRMWTFIITPIASLVVTILATFLDLTIRGEESARQPLFGASKENDNNNSKIQEVEEAKEESFAEA